MLRHQSLSLRVAVKTERNEAKRLSRVLVAILVLVIATWLCARRACAEGDQAAQDLANQLNANRNAAVQRGQDPNTMTPAQRKQAQDQKNKADEKQNLADYKEKTMNNLAELKELFAKAEAAWKEQHYAIAALIYKSITLATVPGSEDMVEKSRAKLIELEDLAKGHLKAVDDADLNQDYMKEVDELSLIRNEFKSTTANDTATRRLIDLKSRSEVAGYIEYAQGESLEKDGKLMDALNLYKTISSNPRYEHSVAALKAQRRLDELNKNEETRTKIKSEMAAKADKEAPVFLNSVKNYLANGKTQLAIEKLQMVVDKYPGSQYAEQAQKQLEELKK